MTVAWDWSVYLVTDSGQCRAAGRGVVETVAAAVRGGVSAVQLRDKDLDAEAFTDLAVATAAVLPATVPLIVNDRVDVFLAARARGAAVAGVHVGQDDLSVEAVRRLVGPTAVIGLSAATPAELAAAASSAARVGYVGLGAVRATRSKADAPPSLGVDGAVRRAAGCPLPVVAIGGIGPDDLPALRAGGLAGAAVVSWVCAAADPERAAAVLRRAWDGSAPASGRSADSERAVTASRRAGDGSAPVGRAVPSAAAAVPLAKGT
ncbi:MAG: thiamine phosphate synthase [Propionibacteriaceae bacterium]|nr:thiamine phosphate synthase [Propionibacteriaceae bacterium]